jgi:hypothetical protein
VTDETWRYEYPHDHDPAAGDPGGWSDAPDTIESAAPWCNGRRIGTAARCGASNRHAPHAEGERPRVVRP